MGSPYAIRNLNTKQKHTLVHEYRMLIFLPKSVTLLAIQILSVFDKFQHLIRIAFIMIDMLTFTLWNHLNKLTFIKLVTSVSV